LPPTPTAALRRPHQLFIPDLSSALLGAVSAAVQ
jgi:hypothetical protein